MDLQLARLCVVRVSSDRLQLLFILSHMDSSRDFGRNSVVPTVCLLLEQMNAHATIVGAIAIVFSNAWSFHRTRVGVTGDTCQCFERFVDLCLARCMWDRCTKLFDQFPRSNRSFSVLIHLFVCHKTLSLLPCYCAFTVTTLFSFGGSFKVSYNSKKKLILFYCDVTITRL